MEYKRQKIDNNCSASIFTQDVLKAIRLVNLNLESSALKIKDLCQVINENDIIFQALLTLNISRNKIHKEDFKEFTQILIRHPLMSLLTLDISYNEIAIYDLLQAIKNRSLPALTLFMFE